MKLLGLCLCLSLASLTNGQPVKSPKEVNATRKLANNNIGRISWPFFAKDDDYFLNLTIGEPQQKIFVSMYYLHEQYDLRINSKVSGGSYDDNASSTYHAQTPAYHNGDYIGENSLETFEIGGVTLKDKPFLLTQSNGPCENYIGFGDPADNSFLASIFSTQKNRGITFAFNDYPDWGFVTLGDFDKTYCYKDWRMMRKYHVDGTSKWGVYLDSISAGKYAFSRPGYLLFTIYDEPLRWPSSVYHSILKAVGSVDGLTVPCNTNVTIDFKVGDVTIQLTPEDYLDTEMEKKKDVCLLIGETVQDSREYMFPRSLFKDHCLNVNHFTQEVGIATRKTE